MNQWGGPQKYEAQMQKWRIYHPESTQKYQIFSAVHQLLPGKVLGQKNITITSTDAWHRSLKTFQMSNYPLSIAASLYRSNR